MGLTLTDDLDLGTNLQGCPSTVETTQNYLTAILRFFGSSVDIQQ